MPAHLTSLLGRPLTAAERKARQRSSEKAVAEAIDKTLVEIFQQQCGYLTRGLIHRETTIRELAHLVAAAFPQEERARVWARLGLEPPAKP